MAWTNEQLTAIKQRKTNILVSAGAGSGKTAVLSERVLEFIAEGNSINDLLILTFTKAAALEMKERIYRKLLSNGFIEEANLTLNANITTFDAYALALVKKYYYYLDIDPQIGIADNNIISEEKKRILTTILEDLYNTNDKEFYNFLIRENVKDDKVIIDNIIELSNKLDLLVDTNTYLNDYEKTFYNEDKIKKLLNSYTTLVLNEFSKLKETIYNLTTILDEENDKLNTYLQSLIYELDHINNYDELVDFINNIKLPSLKKGTLDNVKDEKNKLSKKITDLKLRFLAIYPNEESVYQDLLNNKGDILFLIKIILKLNEEVELFKKKYSYYTFTDIAKLAIELVKNNQDVRQELMKLKEILVDEYQDTSDLQETFLSYITNDNLYMVGDIKQSIYRFRNANPYIFKTKYQNYKKNKQGMKIDLNKNFRSRKEVLNAINLVFCSIMTNDVGDANYLLDGQMHYGLLNYDDYAKSNYEMEVLSYSDDEEYSKAELEIFICANKVKELINNNYTYTSKGLRKTSYKDIAIIVDKSTNFILFKKIFEYLGIPLSIEKNLDIKDNDLTKTIIATLNLVCDLNEDNNDAYFKRDLTSFLRSFIMEYNDEDIYNIIVNNNYNIDILNELKQIDLAGDSLATYYTIINKIKLYEKLPLVGNVENSLTIIDYIGDLLVNYSKLGYDFIKSAKFLADLINSDSKLEYKSESLADDEVRLMTIHHSKGLEYPYCIFPFLDSKKNNVEDKKRFNLSLDYGIYVKKSGENNDKSAIGILDRETEKNKELSEKVRLLYVALTRAREKIILIVNDKDNYNADLKTFKDMLIKADVINKFSKKVKEEELGLTHEYNVAKINDIITKEGKNISYPNKNYHSKVLVKGEISKNSLGIINKETRYVLELGTNIHETLACLDLKKPDYSLVKAEYKTKIKDLLSLELFKDIEKANIYQEYEFYFTEQDKSYYGIMDLLLEYDDHYVIIDYKLAHLDKEEYKRQLSVYYRYLKTFTTKPIFVYLVSILRLEVKDLTDEL